MLRELHISNLAVIADARVEFDGGLNCFTGATGAGKSLVIGAIELLLGLRSPADMLRAGADDGRVTGLFEVKDAEQLRQLDAITDLPISAEDGEVLLVRKLHTSGRSTASLNGSPITLAMLKAIGEVLVDVHGQNDSQYLLKPSNQLDVIDRFADLEDLRGKYHAVYTELTEAKRLLADLGTGERLRKQQLELLSFQADEIDKAELDPGEHVELEQRASVLENVERIRREATAAHASLYDADDAVIDRLKTLHGTLADLATLDPNLRGTADAIKSGIIQLEEAAYDINRYVGKLDVDPEELAETNERLNTINRLIRKYGLNVEAVLAFRASIQTEIDQLSNAATNAEELTKKIAPLEKRLREIGAELTRKRTAAARGIAPCVQSQLGELGMEKAKFDVALVALPEAAPSGFDAVEFMVQTNPGLPQQPLRRIASGGETGRIMLAIKGVLAGGQGVSAGVSGGASGDASKGGTCDVAGNSRGEPGATVLVFDEIDSNIGGRLGSVIGAKLRQLAGRQQVLCITHLPQIACYADRHLTVRKVQTGDRTQTTVREMTGDDRIEEIAEMIGGKTITPTTRAQARELLELAQNEIKPRVKVSVAPAAKRSVAKKR